MPAHFINENESLATELLHELKVSAKRWFIIAIVELVIIIGIVAGFLWYISLPTEEVSYTMQDMQDIENSVSTQNANIGN